MKSNWTLQWIEVTCWIFAARWWHLGICRFWVCCEGQLVSSSVHIREYHSRSLHLCSYKCIWLVSPWHALRPLQKSYHLMGPRGLDLTAMVMTMTLALPSSGSRIEALSVFFSQTHSEHVPFSSGCTGRRRNFSAKLASAGSRTELHRSWTVVSPLVHVMRGHTWSQVIPCFCSV